MSNFVHAQFDMCSRSIQLVIGKDTPYDGRCIALPLQFVPYTSGEYAPPCVQLSQEEAQQLVDQLWNCGLRPTEGAGSAGSLAATEKHLKDMQEITKGLLHKFGVIC